MDLWRGLPMDAAIQARSWDIPIAEIPDGHDQRVGWLYDHFAQIDAWIESAAEPPVEARSGS